MCPEFHYERLARQVQLAKPTEKRFRGHARPRCSEYIFDLVWSRLGVETAELSEIAVDREVFQVLLGLLPPRATAPRGKADMKMNGMNNIYVISFIHPCLKVLA